MLAEYPFFNDLISNVELALSKVDLSLAGLYADLVIDRDLRERVFRMVTDEYRRTKRMILRMNGHEELLEGDPALARSLKLRNPYVDPMSLIQIELLRRRSARDTPGPPAPPSPVFPVFSGVRISENVFAQAATIRRRCFPSGWYRSRAVRPPPVAAPAPESVPPMGAAARSQNAPSESPDRSVPFPVARNPC